MTDRIRSAVLGAAITALVATNANATLIAVDDSVYGPGAVTLDTDTGTEWLDIRLTTGLSYDEMVAEQAAGGAFESWTHAGVDEVRGLWAGAGIECNDGGIGTCHGEVVGAGNAPSPIGGLMGFTSDLELNGFTGTQGLNGAEFRQFAFLQLASSSGDGVFASILPFDDFPEAFKSDGTGHWLSRTAIPEPTGALLFAAGIVVLARARRI